MTIDAGLPAWLKASKIDGVVARVDKHTVGPLRALRVPVVDVRCRHRFSGIPHVETDDRLVARLAFEHLWERGFRRFAFCGFKFAHYSELRLRHFSEFVEEAGSPLSVYETRNRANAPVTSIEESGLFDTDEMSAWLRSLPAPTGMLVCNDIRGQQVLNECRAQGISVPDDVGVIGVDDDDMICPLSDPPLSSVRPDAERVGYRAAATLNAMMRGQSMEDSVEFIEPISVIQRLSTQVSAVEDRELARVCRFIREHACEGIDVSDVAAITDLSRRQLERRFRLELSRTLHEEITSVRISRICQLLKESDMTLEQITPLAGYKHQERLCAVFKRETGETPSEYRAKVSGGVGKVG